MPNFWALPPEINSTRIYLGPGSGPILAAAQGWNALASELDRGLMGVLGGRGQPLHIRQGLLYQSLRRLTPIRLQQRVER